MPVGGTTHFRSGDKHAGGNGVGTGVGGAGVGGAGVGRDGVGGAIVHVAMHSLGDNVPAGSCAHWPVCVLQLYMIRGLGVGFGVGFGVGLGVGQEHDPRKGPSATPAQSGLFVQPGQEVAVTLPSLFLHTEPSQWYLHPPCTATPAAVLHAQSESAAQRPVPSAAVQAAVQSTEEDSMRGGVALQ